MHDFYPRNYYSFATHTNCTNLGHGSFRWCGDAGNGTVKCETGTSCSDARQTFCNRHGPGGGKCYGDKGAPPSSQQLGKKIHHTDANPLGGQNLGGVIPTGTGDHGNLLDNVFGPPSKKPDKNPATQCTNCGDNFLNPGQWSCQVQKALCEAQHGVGGAFGAIPWTLVAVGGGALILLLILLKRR